MMDEKDLKEFHSLEKQVKGMKKSSKYNYIQKSRVFKSLEK